MARISKYIGSVKEVGSYTFTVVDVEKQRFTVEINKPGTDFTEIEIVSRGAWVRGVFSKIMKRFELEDMVGTVKESYGWLFKIVEATKEFVSIICEGFEGEEIISMNRWKKGRFGKTIMGKNTGFRRILSNCRGLILHEIQRVIDQQKLEDEMLMNDNTLDAFKGCDTLEDAKNTYKRLAKIYHPDHGGSQEDFMKLKDRYDFTVRRIQRFLNCLEGLGIKF